MKLCLRSVGAISSLPSACPPPRVPRICPKHNLDWCMGQPAIDKVVELGVADRNAVAVGGHSYGAFMTANLLAHAPDLFCCGESKAAEITFPSLLFAFVD